MSDWTEADPEAVREPVPTVALTEKQIKARRNRSVALGLVLGILAVVFFVATLDKLGANLVGIDAMRDL